MNQDHIGKPRFVLNKTPPNCPPSGNRIRSGLISHPAPIEDKTLKQIIRYKTI